jgi:hypothetical protein
VNVSRRAAVAVLLLVGAWVVGPTVMPLYDGPGAPDEPYRYVVAPPGYTKKTPAPTTATATLPVSNGLNNAAAFAASAEVGPQVRVFIPAGWLRAPAGATSIQVTAVPSAAKPPLPSDGTIVSDVYTVTATADGGPVEYVGKNSQEQPVLQMRAPTAQQPGPTFEQFDGKHWKPAETTRVLQDVYQTFAPKFGVWALVQQKPAGAAFGGVQLLLLVLGIVILAVVGIILLVRLVRRPPPQPVRPKKR